MDKEEARTILQSQEFRELVVKRWSISLILTALMLVIYFGFILVLAFDKAVLAQKIGEHVTLGIPIGVGVIVAAWILTGIYVAWANSYYDNAAQRIRGKSR